VLRKISGHKKDDVVSLGGWKLGDLNRPPSKVMAVKSTRLWWAGNVARMRK